MPSSPPLPPFTPGALSPPLAGRWPPSPPGADSPGSSPSDVYPPVTPQPPEGWSLSPPDANVPGAGQGAYPPGTLAPPGGWPIVYGPPQEPPPSEDRTTCRLPLCPWWFLLLLFLSLLLLLGCCCAALAWRQRKARNETHAQLEMVGVDKAGLLNEECEMNNLFQNPMHFKNPLAATDNVNDDGSIGNIGSAFAPPSRGSYSSGGLESLSLLSSIGAPSDASRSRGTTCYSANPLAMSDGGACDGATACALSPEVR